MQEVPALYQTRHYKGERMYKNIEHYNDPTAGEAIKKYTHSNKLIRSNLSYGKPLTYKMGECMDNNIKRLYGLNTSL